MLPLSKIESRIDVINQLHAYRNSLISPLHEVIHNWIGKKVVKADVTLISKFKEALLAALPEPQYTSFNGEYRHPHHPILQARKIGGIIDIIINICYQTGPESCNYQSTHIYLAVYEDQCLVGPHKLLDELAPLYNAQEQYHLLRELEELELKRREITLQIHPFI